MKTILVIKLGALGDFVQALGPMKAIRGAHPGDRLILLTTPAFARLGQDCGYFDEIYEGGRPKFMDFAALNALRKYFKSKSIDRVYDLQNNDRTQLMFWLWPGKRPEWVGAARGASHRNDSPIRTAGLAFEGHRQTLALAGIDNIESDPLLWMDAFSACSKDYDLPEKFVIFVPGSSAAHPYKRWPVESYAALGQIFLTRDVVPVLIGTKAEAETLSALEDQLSGSLNLCGATSLYDVAYLARRAEMVIGNDTGPMHIAGPTGAKCCVLFSGHSSPKRHRPLGTHVQALQKDDLKDLRVEDVWAECSKT